MPVPKVTTANKQYVTTPVAYHSEHAIKIGSKLGISGYEDATPVFIKICRYEKLTGIISCLLDSWGLSGEDSYALKCESGYFVTESNRSMWIREGVVLIVSYSPAKTVENLVEKLKLYSGFDELEELAPDPVFIYELTKIKEEITVISLILDRMLPKESFASLLNGLYFLLAKDRSWWEDRAPQLFSRDILEKIHSYLTSNPTTSSEEKILLSSFKILLTLVPFHYTLCFEIISVPDVLRFLKTDGLNIQRLSIALINALFENGSDSDRGAIKKEMENEKARTLIVTHIIGNPKKHTKEMNHELYLLQTLLLNQLRDRMMTPVASQDQSALEKIKELRKRAFNTHSTDTPNTQPRAHRYNQDYKKLGFRNDVDPTQDFRETPPGTLALDLMYSFCNHHVEQYRKLILENSCRGDEHDCPFASASIELVKLIVDIVRIGEVPLLDQDRYYPMFFTHDNPLEEFFSICIVHLNKTWQEMRATTEDFSKVMDVTREQINFSLSHAPSTLEEFKRRLRSYSEVQDAWKEEAKLRGEREGNAVKELKKAILPDVQDLVRRQRLNFACAGSKFPKYKDKSGRYVFAKLSNNHKTLFYRERFEDDLVPSTENLDSKIQIAEIKDLTFCSLTSNAPSIVSSSSLTSTSTSRSKSRGDQMDLLSFCILVENGEALDLVAPDQKSFDYWTDALNVLLGRPMMSSEARKDVDSLMSMEVKLQLLDVEGLDIPEEEPEIPPSPPDYNFGLDD